MVTRHWAMADGTKSTSRDLGAASPKQKPAGPASEVVGEPLQRRRGDPRTPPPAAQKLDGVVAPVAFYEVVAATTVHGQDRRVRGSSHSSLSVSVLRLWLRDSSITASSRRRLCPRDALHRFTALSGDWPFAGDSEASDWQPMALGDGTPEWADSLFWGRDRGLRVPPCPPAQYDFVGFPEAVSSVYTRVLAGLSVPPVHGRLALSKRP